MANLKISELPVASVPTTGDELAAVNGGTTKKLTIGDIANLTAFGVSGNTSGTCISDIYVSTVNSCSPLVLKSNNQIIATLTDTSGFAMESGVNFVIPTGSAILDGAGDSLVSEDSNTNKYSANGKTGFASDYWGGDIYRTEMSGTSTATTATTRVSKSFDIETGIKTKDRYVNPDGGSEYITSRISEGHIEITGIVPSSMYYPIVGGLDDLNTERESCTCSSQNGGTYTKWPCPCFNGDTLIGPYPSERVVNTFINKLQNVALYTIDSAVVEGGVIGTSYLHSNYSASKSIQTSFDTNEINTSEIIVDLDYNLLTQRNYNTSELITTEIYNGSSTGMTGTTRFEKSYDFVNGSYTQSVINPYWTDGFTGSEWDQFGVYRTSITGETSGTTATTKFDTAYDLINGIKSETVTDENGVVGFNGQEWDAGLRTTTITGGTGDTKVIKTVDLETSAYKTELIKGSDTYAIIDFSIAGVGGFGSTSTSLHNGDFIVNETESIVESAYRIKSATGEFNFGTISGAGLIPDNPDAAIGNVGDCVTDGTYIYVKAANFKWGRTMLDQAW